ncbi:YjbH domain-containing protein [Sinimarinibacterium sp. CAU 1509]|uniref:YjbH domain-containing protein n=1 Tax=Sinimarinibacterium sp. CAU 1509 TaxID=2562283 RepID=UPI0010ABECF5|nr:YjbH domain-containing protein [Sinimarinibacterium sp. CAU 1509]TJY61942.1 YjbH domain-containing protein [Sinimarinibacterium sp. CAU 1509]
MFLRSCAAAAVIFSSAAWADASPDYAMQGFHGLLTVPDADVTPEGALHLQYNNDIESTAPESFDTVENAYFSIGLWRQLEITGRFSKAENDNGRRLRHDLSGNAKLQLYTSDMFSVAVGATDFGGDAQQLRSVYGVGTFKWKGLALTVGGGGGPDTLDGAFGGIRYRVLPFADILADYDGKESSYGARLFWNITPALTVYTTAAGSTDPKQSFSAGGGLAIQFGHRREAPVPASNAVGNRDARSWKAVTSTDTPASSAKTLTEAVRSNSDAGQIREYRYGVPIRRVTVDQAQPQAQWLSLYDSPAAYRWPHWIGGEIRLEPDVRSLVATEYGTLDYSLAIQPSARLQFPFGLAVYGTYDVAVAHSDDVAEGERFENLLHHSDWRDIAGQWLVHPLPGWFTLTTAGFTEIDEVNYGFVHIDSAIHDASGRHQLRFAYGKYEPEDDIFFLPHETRIASYRYFWPRKQLAIRASYGDYFYDDRGGKLEITRYFSDFAIRIYYQRDDDDLQRGGVGLSIPLGVGRGLRAGQFAINGSPRWEYAVGTTINHPSGVNRLTFGDLVEPLPEYNLIKDVLDGDRALPENLLTAPDL